MKDPLKLYLINDLNINHFNLLEQIICWRLLNNQNLLHFFSIKINIPPKFFT